MKIILFMTKILKTKMMMIYIYDDSNGGNDDYNDNDNNGDNYMIHLCWIVDNDYDDDNHNINSDDNDDINNDDDVCDCSEAAPGGKDSAGTEWSGDRRARSQSGAHRCPFIPRIQRCHGLPLQVREKGGRERMDG